MSKDKIVVSSQGVGLGTLIAAFISWKINQSIPWLIWHAFCGWFYVLYYGLGEAGTLP